MLTIDINAYEGLCLHFQDGGFQKLKELYIGNSDELRDIIIDKGALPSLKKLQLHEIRQLKNIPTEIQHLEKLEVLYIRDVQVDFLQRISTEDWNWIMENVPLVEFTTADGEVIPNSRS
ncbi:disease resistance protein [Trifolium medium]|uniref:Disease resistance protein n=1 Tax=Trifolium medium TaxID=97028 RepID=A0A392MMA5_9FABA|nr:disease resistance protein [Trifolium medium]